MQEIAPDTEIHFAIADNGQDSDIISHTPFLYTVFPVAKLRRYFSLENVRDFFRFFSNIIKAFFFLKKNRPHVVFSKGGFVSLPIGICAKILKIPLLLHESDSTMGLSNSILSHLATLVFCGFPGTPFQYVGNPVREEFFCTNTEKQKNERPFLLILGGSQGAQFLNEWIIKNAPKINTVADILLVSGKNFSPPKGVQNQNFTIVPFLYENFSEILQKSDVVISRAGAGSISEISASRKCAILVPLPSSANDHQRKNAKLFASQQACQIWEQEEMEKYSETHLKNLFILLQNSEKRKEYEEKIALFSTPHTAEILAKEILKKHDGKMT